MEGPDTQQLTLIRIRLVADIARAAQCSKDEFEMVIDLIFDMADLAIAANDREHPGTHLGTDDPEGW